MTKTRIRTKYITTTLSHYWTLSIVVLYVFSSYPPGSSLLNLLQTVTIFAYGVTSSGKTYTMQGTKLEPGVIPRVVEVSEYVLCMNLFSMTSVQGIFKKKQLQKHDTTLAVSYMEIYKDEVYDLFVTRENVRLPFNCLMSLNELELGT
jgi:hypothetical protein